MQLLLKPFMGHKLHMAIKQGHLKDGIPLSRLSPPWHIAKLVGLKENFYLEMPHLKTDFVWW